MSQISRRSVLRGLGTVVALPALEAMTSSQVFGNSMTPALTSTGAPKRMAFLYVPNGMHMEEWTPDKTGKDFDLKMLIVKPRASSKAPRHAEVIPLPSDETTPPVINTYEVIDKTRFPDRASTGGNNKGLEQSTMTAVCFFQPLIFAPSLD